MKADGNSTEAMKCGYDLAMDDETDGERWESY